MRLELKGGDARPRSVLASTQRRLNMYAELTDPRQGEPFTVTHYPTPGLKLITTTPNGKPIRGLYRASNGDLYCVADLDVYYIDSDFQFHHVGTMDQTHELNVVKFADNGTSVIFCDGTQTKGYSINMKTRASINPLLDPGASDALTTASTGWLGSTYVDFTDGFLVANYIDTPTFYISNSEDIIFDPLQFASKNGYPDALVAAIVQHRVIWLIGELSTEVWYNSGGSGTGESFPFSIMPGVAIDHGCMAKYSIAKGETSIFWLAQSLNGERYVLQGNGYNVKRISTHPIENQLSEMPDAADCIAYCYTQQGHTFYVMNFPSADKTFVFDLASGLWHERCYTDDNGEEHRHRSTMHAHAYGLNLVNDWQNGNLYALDLNTYTDDGQFIKRVIGLPRLIEPQLDHRVVYKYFIPEIDCGEILDPNQNPQITLRWSDDKGRTWGNGLEMPLGKAGGFADLIKYQRLGQSRNRVFQLEWNADAFVAVQGGYVDLEVSES